MIDQKTPPAVRNWRTPALKSSAAMLAVQARATACQTPIIALTTNVQYAKALAT